MGKILERRWVADVGQERGVMGTAARMNYLYACKKLSKKRLTNKNE